MTPFWSCSLTPLETAGIYSLGITPPLISSINSNSSSLGSILIRTWPYWPLPPDCFAYLASTSTFCVIASLYATWGLPTFASTLNSLFILSTKTSKCNSPIPDIIVWPDSSSELTLKEGSSCASLPSAIDIFSWSGFDFGSTAKEITGSGNSILSRTTKFFSSDKVSPVVTFLRPMQAAMSPALTSFISSLLLECICTILPILSLSSLTVFITPSPWDKTPE